MKCECCGEESESELCEECVKAFLDIFESFEEKEEK